MNIVTCRHEKPEIIHFDTPESCLNRLQPIGLYEQLINIVPDEKLRALPDGAFEGHPSLQNILDISEPIAIGKPAYPQSLCFFGSTLSFGGFFICPEAV